MLAVAGHRKNFAIRIEPFRHVLEADEYRQQGRGHRSERKHSAHRQGLGNEIEEAGWDKLWFSWRGPVDPKGIFYYRVHGPRVLIEYNRQDANHDHMIVRDPTNDYGEDWLGKHYKESHPSMAEAMENARRRAEAGSAGVKE
ncbi:MAG: DUF3500 domain-containing protein [Woeseiaceae bacterium]